MINPNETKSVFWLLMCLIIAGAAYGVYRLYKHKKQNIAPEPEPEPAPVETEEVTE